MWKQLKSWRYSGYYSKLPSCCKWSRDWNKYTCKKKNPDSLLTSIAFSAYKIGFVWRRAQVESFARANDWFTVMRLGGCKRRNVWMLCLSHSFGQLERMPAFKQLMGGFEPCTELIRSICFKPRLYACFNHSTTVAICWSGSGAATLALHLCFSAQREFSWFGKCLNKAQPPSAAAWV